MENCKHINEEISLNISAIRKYLGIGYLHELTEMTTFCNDCEVEKSEMVGAALIWLE